MEKRDSSPPSDHSNLTAASLGLWIGFAYMVPLRAICLVDTSLSR
jgi:hypothetical protein